MIDSEVPPEFTHLLRLLGDDLVLCRAERHHEDLWTITAVSPDHHAVRGRFNRGLSGRWTWLPLSINKLDIVSPGGWVS